jgi:signal transduction histidine kinase
MLARLRTNPMDVLIALTIAVVLELEIVLGGERGAGAASLVAGLAISVPLAWRRLVPLEVVLVYAVVGPLQGLLGGELFSGDPPLAGALAAGVVAFYSLAAYAPDRRATIGLLAGVAGMWAGVFASDAVDVQSFVFSAGLIGLAPWLAGRATRARRLRSEALERERDQRARAAASEERQRIARELHDVVAHGVVLMVLQAQGARRILDQDPARARDALQAIEETGRTALEEIRGSLGILREEDAPVDLAPQPTLGDLAALIEETRRAGLTVDLRVEGDARAIPDGVDRSAYRIIQEALTNTIKHAGLVPTRVTVAYGTDELTLEVVDDGPGQSGSGDGGQGLVGMRERVRVYGGEIEAHARNGRGFVVRARIPLGT